MASEKIINLERTESYSLSLGSDLINSCDLNSSSCKKVGRVAEVVCEITSKTNSDVSFPTNGTVILTGLPTPLIGSPIMIETFRSSYEARILHRFWLTNGNPAQLINYWDNIVVPKRGEAIVIRFTYITAQ